MAYVNGTLMPQKKGKLMFYESILFASIVTEFSSDGALAPQFKDPCSFFRLLLG